MIVAVNTAQQKAHFLAALGDCPAVRTQMQMRLTLFADLPGSGWQFYTSDAAAPLAIALRGASATVAGAFDAEELGSFLRFLGVETLTTPSLIPPAGYCHKQNLFVYTLAAAQQLPIPPFTGAMAGQEAKMRLDTNPSIGAILPLLWGEDDGTNTEVRDQYYADQCTARNGGMAAFWLASHAGRAIFTLAASAVVGTDAYLSAGETLAPYRGQGVGGHYIATMANEYAAAGHGVSFVCEAVRCRFYSRLGFAQSGVLQQYQPVDASDQVNAS